jgi:protein gp37
MGKEIAISWCDHSWNPWQGCHKVSEGCRFCFMYSEKIRYGQQPNLVVRSKPATFNAPLKWKEPARVFTCSWSDWFIEEADAWRDEAWDIVRRTPHLTYQILTKRPERIAAHLPAGPLPNVWLGVSIENDAARERLEPLLDVRSRVPVLFISAEPLIAPVDLFRFEYAAVDWVIVGGESGPKARPMSLAWARSIVSWCRSLGIACFVKQLGRVIVDEGGHAWAPPSGAKDQKRADPAEWPEDLRVREFPETP